jgi:hypothetical protein
VEKFGWAWKKQSALMLIQCAWLTVVVRTLYFEVKETDFNTFLQEFTTTTNLTSCIFPEEDIPLGRFSLELT